jgi:hypothetical protein
MPITLDGTTGITSPAIDLTTPLVVADGGTGLATLTANNVILGAGTSTPTFVAPGSNGNLLTSNGTTWTSAAAPAGGVTSLNGQTGAITNTTLYAIGSYIIGRPQDNTAYPADTTLAGSSIYATGSAVNRSTTQWNVAANGTAQGIVLVNTGTWRCTSAALRDNQGTPVATSGLWVRIS